MSNKGDGLGLLEVVGNPSARFGTVRLLNRDPVQKEELFSISPASNWDINADCQVIGITSEKEGEFANTCGADSQTFLFARNGYGLIGLSKFLKQTTHYAHALSVKAFIAGPHDSTIMAVLQAAVNRGAASAARTANRAKVIACYTAGNTTVADMYACAGAWGHAAYIDVVFS
jgi:hypothetical protein